MTAKSPRACSARLTGVTVASVDMEAILGNNRKTGPYAGPAPGNTQASRQPATCGAGFIPANDGWGSQTQPEPTSAGRHEAGPTKSRSGVPPRRTLRQQETCGAGFITANGGGDTNPTGAHLRRPA